MRADAQANREAILDAAEELFAQRGPEVSFRAIARHAHVGIATVQRHFPDRLSLFSGMSERVLDAFYQALQRHDAQWDANPATAWHDTISDLVTSQLVPLISIFTPYLLEHGHEELARHLTDTIVSNVHTAYADLLARAEANALVPAGLDPLRFHLGLVSIARPLPDITHQLAPRQPQWLVALYLEGLHSQAEKQQPSPAQDRKEQK
ncbi:TetR/AcrR family transcriptional regulator [Corynebacterium uberis]|uniref:TetR/AcrR family transcriptional regulator n=1 Tax=Corynebacterium TaxID=1716 RepID=UPI001D0BD7BD|nr:MULTISPECIES: TetR/AcrR family transcriptional regulator [Corynebacterium]MCZ9308954.1 TetR/AcrR family transcriptional regulator [Corynebacterium sp. c6VSa_13]UDL74575.1 TetR/AcrR family transcriptional regulator [Corynebacterium uberis]UDL76591.1 TetR/AcrR family transcriptional regulator [Corynebacterium uberis]UDL78804.1 TetR/AcrR family transcriptional regulator [Corynebacterium uberis]UDL81082.1 TetR/AcrR family transcriptional regulator [Corynebacterium uberis]